MRAALPIERRAIRRSDLWPEIVPLLIGRVFHVTPADTVEKIEASGAIMSNRDEQFGFTFPQSQNSYGRLRGYVCLFDLRDVSDDVIRDTLRKFNFLKPTRADPAFLFLDESHYPNLIPWTEAPVSAMAIPLVEAWYPNAVPVTALSHALALAIEDDDPDSSYRGVMRSLREDGGKILDSGPVPLEARTVDELRQRAEGWTRIAREAGLQVDLGWDPGRIEVTPYGFGIWVHAVRTAYWRDLGQC